MAAVAVVLHNLIQELLEQVAQAAVVVVLTQTMLELLTRMQ
jgi:hypothetical protein